jgi:hypothetical protein
MKHSYKRQVIVTGIFLIAVCALIMLLITVFNGNHQKDNGTIKNSLTDENDTLELTGVLPMSDLAIKSKDITTFDEGIVDYVKFKVTSNNYEGPYTIYVKSCNEDIENVIEDEYIKVLLTDTKDKLITSTPNGEVDTYATLKVKTEKPTKKVVYEDSIGNNEEKEYVLKTWVSNSSLPDKDKKFCLKVSVE